MGEIRERIARAIEPKSWAALYKANDSMAHEHRRTSSERKADRILAALAEPTEAMIEAGFCANIVVLSSKPRTTKACYPPADNIARVWKAMIGTAR